MYYSSCIVQVDNMNKKLLEQLLASWEETHKKGQLTFWIFLALHNGEKYADEIRIFVQEMSNYTMSCEEQSLYRILRKFEHIEVVSHRTGKGNKGPERKYYYLTSMGQELFKMFVERNILIFYSREIKKLINF